MKNIIIAAFLLFICQVSAFAGFSKLVAEFLDENYKVKSAVDEVELARLNQDIVNGQFGWQISLGFTKQENDLDAATSLNFNKGENDISSLTLSKALSWGGSFSLENSLTTQKRDPVTLAVFGGGDAKQSEFYQTFSYSQDLWSNFLGRNNRLDILESELKYQAQKQASNMEVSNSLLELFQAYLEARFQLALTSLNEKALVRAQKREKLIARRVRDGLGNKVDLYQAKESTLLAREQLKQSKQAKLLSISSLSSLLHRDISETEVRELIQTDVFIKPSEKINVLDNFQIGYLKRQLALLEAKLEKSKNEIYPDLNLSIYYKTNDFNSSSSEAVSNGNITGDKFEKAVSLNLTWSIGSPVQSSMNKVSNVNVHRGRRNLEAVKRNLDYKISDLTGQATLLEENTKITALRLGFAQKRLKEYTRLYRLGKASLDQVIRSEENLIQTEVSLVSAYRKRDHLFALMAQLGGGLQKYLLGDN